MYYKKEFNIWDFPVQCVRKYLKQLTTAGMMELQDEIEEVMNKPTEGQICEFIRTSSPKVINARGANKYEWARFTKVTWDAKSKCYRWEYTNEWYNNRGK